MERRRRWGGLLFRTGAVLLLLLGTLHGFGHWASRAQAPTDPDEQRVHQAMYGTRFPIGSVERSFGELYDGMSLYFVIGPIATGLLALATATRRRRDPALLRSTAVIEVLWLSSMVWVAWRYWFPLPLLFLVLPLGAFAAAWWVLPEDGY